MKRGETPVSGHIRFMPRSRIRRISEGFKIFFPLPFSSEVSITKENYVKKAEIF
jgi:hypothetical protein